jgi:hypothetical protein
MCTGGLAQCLSTDDGEVCADDSDGSVKFSGTGLDADSEVVVNHPELGNSTFVVESDSTFEADGRGFLAFVVGTTITFTISAVDPERTPIEGEIVVTS